MQIVLRSPFRAGSILWQKGSTLHRTVVCKATFALRPGECVLAPEQDGLVKEEQHWGHDAARSLRVASDLTPRKPRVDVLVVGYAYAPGRAPARSVVARITIGDWQKAVEAWCPRCFDPLGRLQEGQGLTQFQLLYDRAAAGPENPAGVRPGTRDADGRVDIPSVVPVGTRITSPADTVLAIGLGPIAATWPLRSEKLGRYRASWSDAQWFRTVLGDDFDFAYFQSAPLDQRLSTLRGDERIVLENLHPDQPTLKTALPGIRPTAHIEQPGKAPVPVALQADTLLVDTARGLCTVVWRGSFVADDPDAEGHIVIGREQVGSGGAKPKEELQGTLAASADAASDAPLPTGWAAGAPAPGRISALPPEVGLPFAQGPRPPDAHSPSPAEPPAAPPPAAPPPAVAPPPIHIAQGPPEPAPMLTFGQAAVAAQKAAAVATAARDAPPVVGGVQKPELLSPIKDDDPSAATAAQVAAHGVLGASNAVLPMDVALGAMPAKASAAPRIQAPLSAGELLRLVWHDPDGASRVRRRQEFRPILGELDKRPPDADLDASGDPAEIEDRRELLEIMLVASPEGANGIRALLNEGMREDGKFVPLVGFLSGELEHVFDPLDMLKALLPVAASFVAGEDALGAAVDASASFLGAPGLPGPGVAEALCTRLRKAFAETRKAQRQALLTEQAERTLCEQRRFQRRSVLGDTYVRALLHTAGSPHPIPCYFPEAAVKKLPMSARSRVRLLAETHLRADPYEMHPAALRVLALAEVLPGARV
jgi:hypothetical protein